MCHSLSNSLYLFVRTLRSENEDGTGFYLFTIQFICMVFYEQVCAVYDKNPFSSTSFTFFRCLCNFSFISIVTVRIASFVLHPSPTLSINSIFPALHPFFYWLDLFLFYARLLLDKLNSSFRDFKLLVSSVNSSSEQHLFVCTFYSRIFTCRVRWRVKFYFCFYFICSFNNLISLWILHHLQLRK